MSRTRHFLVAGFALLFASAPVFALHRSIVGIDDALAGRNDEAEVHLATCIANHPEDLRCAIAFAALREARGDTNSALDALVAPLEHDARTPLAAGALARLVTLAARANDGGARARSLLEQIVLGAREVNNPEMRSLAALGLADILARGDEPQFAQRLLVERAGRSESWTLIGPYGRIAPLALTRVFAPERGELDGGEDTQAAGQPRQQRLDTRFADGRVIFPSSLMGNGAVYALTDLLTTREELLRLRISSRGPFRVFVDGSLALTVDRYRLRPPLAPALMLRLDAGRHRLMIKCVGAGSLPPLSVSLERSDGTALGAGIRFEHPTGTPSGKVQIRHEELAIDRDSLNPRADDATAFIAATWWLRARGMEREAGEVLKRAHAQWPDASIFSALVGEFFYRAETGAAPEEDLALARAHLEAALDADPRLLRARLQLAEMDLSAGQKDEAWHAANTALELEPGQPDALLMRHRIAAGRGWEVEARAAIEEALTTAPGRSDLLRAAIDFYRRSRNAQRLHALLEKQHARYPQEAAYADLLASEGRNDEALAAWNDLIAAAPSNATAWAGKARLLTDTGRYEELLQTLDEAERLFPREDWIPRQRAGALALLGRDDAANAALVQALELAPSHLALRQSLTRRGVLSDRLSHWLVDAREVIDKDRPRSGTDSALLADIAATLIDRNAGQTELYQGIHGVYTRAGVEHEGELQILPGALIDAIRIHKKDRRTVDVNPGGRRPVHLPGLEVGDAIEYVTRRYTPPMQALAGALDNRTIFLFQGDDRDYILSRYALVHRAGLPVEVCGNQEGLERTDTIEDGWRVRSWTARQMPRIYVEPHVTDRLEITPLIRLGLGLSWEDIGDLFRGALIGKTRLDPPLPSMIDTIRRRAGSEEPAALARTMHALVNERIHPGRTALSLSIPASASASAGEGNRVGVALALAQGLGLTPSLVFTRPVELHGTGLDCPSSSVFSYVMLRIDLPGDRVVYLDYTDADHPFDTIASRLAGADALLVPMDEAAIESGDLSRLIDIPRRETPILQDQEATVTLDANGRVTGVLKLRLRGPFASVTRRLIREVPADRLPQVFQALAGDVFPGARVTARELLGADDPESDFLIIIHFEDGLLARRTPSGFAFPRTSQPLGIVPEFGSLRTRTQPMLFNVQAFRHDLTRIQLPEGLELERAPDNFSADGRFGRFEIESSLSDGVLRIERVAKLPPLRIEVQDYADFREFAQAVDRAESSELSLSVRSPSMGR